MSNGTELYMEMGAATAHSRSPMATLPSPSPQEDTNYEVLYVQNRKPVLSAKPRTPLPPKPLPRLLPPRSSVMDMDMPTTNPPALHHLLQPLPPPITPRRRLSQANECDASTSQRQDVVDMPPPIPPLPPVYEPSSDYLDPSEIDQDLNSYGSRTGNKNSLFSASNSVPSGQTALEFDHHVHCTADPMCSCTEWLRSFDWFQELEREEANKGLINYGVEGTFLVRRGKRAGRECPYSLSLFHSRKVFHLNIRRRAEDGLFALGRWKTKEKAFLSVDSLIDFHQKEPILLTSNGHPEGSTLLQIALPSEHLDEYLYAGCLNSY